MYNAKWISSKLIKSSLARAVNLFRQRERERGEGEREREREKERKLHVITYLKSRFYPHWDNDCEKLLTLFVLVALCNLRLIQNFSVLQSIRSLSTKIVIPESWNVSRNHRSTHNIFIDLWLRLTSITHNQLRLSLYLDPLLEKFVDKCNISFKHRAWTC